MPARFGLIVGAALTGGVAIFLAFVPTDWLAQMMGVSAEDAAEFLLRRYGASATAALSALLIVLLRGASAIRAAYMALALWFAVQGAVAIWGLSTGIAGGLAWVALVADPAIAALLLILWARSAPRN